VANWLCAWGNEIRSSGAIPNTQEWHVISDGDIHALPDPIGFETVLELSRYVYRCDRCDRLHVFWNGIDEWPPTIYVPEQG
jgi:hypothetical protein